MREEGYYWVVVNDGWKIMEWASGGWWEFGTYEELDDGTFDYIDERRIVRGE